MTTDVFGALSVVIILSTLAVLDNVMGLITNPPQNTISLVGHSVTFQCTTNNTDRAVYWQFTNVNGVLQPPIYTGIMNPTYASRGFSVSNSSSSQASEYNLTIARVNLTDAGTYTCQDNNGIGEARAAWLSVLNGNPDCKPVTNGDTVTVTCTAKIYGRISDSNRLVPHANWANCTNATESFSVVENDSFYRCYTWQSYMNAIVNATCIFSIGFSAVVSDLTIDNRLPTYQYTWQYVHRPGVSPTTAPALSTTSYSLSPPRTTITTSMNIKTTTHETTSGSIPMSTAAAVVTDIKSTEHNLSFSTVTNMPAGHRNVPLGGNSTTNGTTTDISVFNTTSNSTTATTVGCPVIVLFLGCLSLVHHLDLP